MPKTRILLLIMIALMIFAFPAGAQAERTITNSDANGVITVRLVFPEGTIGGVTEEIPSGYEFSGTSHPTNQTLVEDKRIYFAVIGEEEIVYKLKGTGKTEISGTWIDFKEEVNETTVKKHETPGFGLPAAIITIAIIALLRRQKR